ncbi:MAG: hypothetical protein ACRDNS_08525 [Trebonia sp.]
MSNLLSNLPHLVMAVVVIAAMVVLAALHLITGAEAVGVIGAAGGFSLGAGGASASISTATHNIVVPSGSESSTATVTVSQDPAHSPAQTLPPAV